VGCLLREQKQPVLSELINQVLWKSLLAENLADVWVYRVSEMPQGLRNLGLLKIENADEDAHDPDGEVPNFSCVIVQIRK
jgi:hypothetical protein